MNLKYFCLYFTMLVIMESASVIATASDRGSSGGSGDNNKETLVNIGKELPEANGNYEQFVYNPHIIINPPTFSAVLGAEKSAACCNCSRFSNIVTAEMGRLQATYRRLAEHTRLQLQRLQASVTDIANALSKLPVTKDVTGNRAPTTAKDSTTTNEKTSHTTPSSAKPTNSPNKQSTTKTPVPSVSSTRRVTTVPRASSTTRATPPPTTTTAPPRPAATAAATAPPTAATPPPTAAAPTPKGTPSTQAAPKSTAAPSGRVTTVQPSQTTTDAVSVEPGVIQKDCSEALAMGLKVSGVYMLQPTDGGEIINVYCDMETDGGGWTVFQRRTDGTVDFYRDYDSYRQGFGSPGGEFWLGNDNLHRLTTQDEYQLRVDLTDFTDTYAYAVYDTFRVADETNKFKLTVGGFSGTAGDSLTDHNNMPFSTKDRDNDLFAAKNCAREYRGAWWYNRCHQSNLNGKYLQGATNEYARGVVWRRWKGYSYSLKTSEMKIRRKI